MLTANVISSPLWGCSRAPQSEFGGSTHLVASACWDHMLCLFGPRVPSFPTHDGKFTMMCIHPAPPDLCRPRHGCPAPSPGPLNPDHEGGGGCSQQVPSTSGQAVPRLQDQVPTAPPRPPSPVQATLHHQEAQHLLLGAGPLSPGLPK